MEEYRIVAEVEGTRHVWNGWRFIQSHHTEDNGEVYWTLEQAQEEWTKARGGFYKTFDSEQNREKAMYVEHRTMATFAIDCSHLNR